MKSIFLLFLESKPKATDNKRKYSLITSNWYILIYVKVVCTPAPRRVYSGGATMSHWMAAAPKQGCVVSVIFLNICLIFKNEVSKYSEELAQIAKNIKNKVLMILKKKHSEDVFLV